MPIILLLLFSLSGWAQEVDFKLFSGTANPQLAQEVADYLQIPLNHATVTRFADGEIRIKIQENIRNCKVYVIQPTCSTQSGSINDHIMELYLMIRTMKRASAAEIIAVIPYYGYARQDRKTESRVPISASDIAMLLEGAGADHVISIDLHCGQIQGFFRSAPVDNLFASTIFVPYMAKKNDLISPVVVSPDAGGVERAKKFIDGLAASGIDSKIAIMVKQRQEAGIVKAIDLIGSVDGCDVIIVDDLCDTAGTLVKAAHELKQKGALRVFACITHPVFSDPALNRIRDSELTELIVANTIPFKNGLPPNVVPLSIAPLLGEAIMRTSNGSSISDLFEH